nr:EOG090X04A7 [Artemia franciscana]
MQLAGSRWHRRRAPAWHTAGFYIWILIVPCVLIADSAGSRRLRRRAQAWHAAGFYIWILTVPCVLTADSAGSRRLCHRSPWGQAWHAAGFYIWILIIPCVLTADSAGSRRLCTGPRGAKHGTRQASIYGFSLRDCELGAIVNRDLSRRIRTVNGITSHKTVVRNDIRLAARIIQNLDSRFGLWQNKDEKEQPKSELEPFSMHSTNPVLKKITDYLIEEASAEEEALLGTSADPEEGENTEDNHSIQRDEELMSVLDRLLIYLRLVHSVDFYNHSEYPNEDEMPNRCGILHARGIPPSSKVTSQELNDYCQQFEKKISPFLQAISKLSDEEGAKLGLKDENTEVEKFITANTQELGKDKWLCPLSGKKFKGPDFVRKHIFNKHVEKIDEVKKEVEYFNNYLRDPKRPQLPEHPGNKQGGGPRVPPPQERPDYGPPSSYQPYVLTYFSVYESILGIVMAALHITPSQEILVERLDLDPAINRGVQTHMRGQVASLSANLATAGIATTCTLRSRDAMQLNRGSKIT